jgi:MFS family permease
MSGAKAAMNAREEGRTVSLAHRLSRWVLPAGVDSAARLLLISRGLRGLCDGFVAVLLPGYLLALGFGQLAVGLISTTTLFGSAIATILVGLVGNRFAQRGLLLFAAGLMMATGLAFAGLSSLWPLLVVAFIGTLNPSSGDVSLFLPLEHARLAESETGGARTALFARYSLVGGLSAAVGALAAGLPDLIAAHSVASPLTAIRVMFIVYAIAGFVNFTLSGALLGLGWLGAPLVACGALKIAYDLSLLVAFRHVRPDGGSS